MHDGQGQIQEMNKSWHWNMIWIYDWIHNWLFWNMNLLFVFQKIKGIKIVMISEFVIKHIHINERSQWWK